MSKMTFGEELQLLRDMLVPQVEGGKFVRLAMNYGYFSAESVQEAIKDIERIAIRSMVTGEKATALEQLAIHLLRDSAGLDVFKVKG